MITQKIFFTKMQKNILFLKLLQKITKQNGNIKTLFNDVKI